jgi:F-type H+-transporting ATPase subunit delta
VSEEQVARVYAQALFDAAQEAHVVREVGRELGDFVAALAASPALRGVMDEPQIEVSAKMRVVVELTRDAQPLVANTLQLLLQRNRFAIVTQLSHDYDELAAAEAAVVNVEVTSAVELTDATNKKIAARVEEATGRRVELAQRVDPAILGGLVLRVGDVIVDGSVRSRISQLRRRLATAELRGDVE